VALTLARIAVNGADFTTNAAVLRRILADPQLPTASRGDIRLSLGLLIVNHAGDRAGFREIARAVDELGDRPERAARAMIALAMNERDGASSRAWTWVRRADAALLQSPDEGVRMAAEATRLTLMARDGDPDVWKRLDRLPRETEDTEVLRQTTRALYNVGDIAIELGHDRRAAVLLAESRELARRTCIAHLESYSRIALVRLEGLGGDWANVEKRFAALLYEYPDIAMGRMEQALLVGLIAAARGQRTRALELFNAAAALGEAESQVTVTLRAAAALAAVRLAEGAATDAWALVVPAVKTLRLAAAWARGTGLVPVAVEAALACGDRRSAEDLVEDADRGLQDRDAPAAAAELHTARGILLDDSEAAAEQFDRARLLWTDIGRPYDRARATERLGFALAAVLPDDALARADEAIAAYTQLGATYDVARCQSTLRGRGLFRPASHGRRGYGDQLSPRERQVAELLARGVTNRDIAQALFLSPRTVEQHVAHVLKKLGAVRQDVGEALRAGRL
jgi:ATP/maltotriose-dependent transcriptional regulator MalT